MPNFQGAVNEVINQAGLYSSLAGGPQELKENIQLGRTEKTSLKQLENLTQDMSRLEQRAEASQDVKELQQLRKRVKAQVEEAGRLRENVAGIVERRYQLDPSQRNYEAYMRTKGISRMKDDPGGLMTKEDFAGRARKYDVARRNAANAKAMMQSQGKKTMMEGIHQYMRQGNMVPLSDPSIMELLEDDNGKQK